MDNHINRKEFITAAALASASLALGFKTSSSLTPLESAKSKICIFSKCMHWLNYRDMAQLVAEIGFDGIDLTVRPEGHVLPERVADDLPKAVAAAEAAGLKVYMITTDINHADQEYTHTILKTASSLGIKYYRTAWFNYNKAIDIPANIEVFKKQLKGLEALNKQYNIHGGYQNHAGEFFGASIWDLWLAIKDLDPKYIGCQYDIRHAAVEGTDTWPIGVELLHKYIRSIAVKDYSWTQINGKYQYKSVPLKIGMVDFKKYLSMLNGYKFTGPMSMHFEYPLGGAEEGSRQITISRTEFTKALKTDLTALKTMLKEAQL